MLDRPEPVERVLCAVCDGSWKDHLRTARHRLVDLKTDVHEDSSQVTEDEVIESVSLLDCIWSLKSRNSGPPGPIGTAGKPGTSAPPCMCMTVLG